MTQTKYRLTEEQKHEDGEKLFDFCAECLQTFIRTNMSSVTEPGEGPAVKQKSDEAGISEGKEGLIKPGQELALGFTVRQSGAKLYSPHAHLFVKFSYPCAYVYVPHRHVLRHH